LLQASPTFEAIERYARLSGAEVVSVPLDRTFAHDLDAMLAHANASTALVYICHPNNPTASGYGKLQDEIRADEPGSFGNENRFFHRGRKAGLSRRKPAGHRQLIVKKTAGMIFPSLT
jgi:hypothetical protein